MSYHGDIVQAVRSARAARGWSQRDLAERAGLHQPQIARVEAGKDVRLSTLGAVLQALDLGRLRLDGLNGREGRGHPMAGMPEAWPDSDRNSFAIFVLVQRGAELLAAASERLARQHGMTSGELSLLGALRRMPPPHSATPTELKRNFWLTLPGITRRLAKLVELGLVELEEQTGDRRRRHYRLGEGGKALIDSLVREGSPEFQALSRLPAEARMRMAGDLQGLVDRLEESVGGVKTEKRRSADAQALDYAAE
jgi:DNA-binding MarR family transcriptional regulator/DNA-binding Xre family transcriptional regulator